MTTLVEILSPSFLLFPAVVGCMLLGAVCPVVGGFLVLRRSVLLGLALPQFAGAGAAGALLAQHLGMVPHALSADFGHVHHETQRMLALGGSLAFTFLGMAVLGLMDRSPGGRSETRLAVAYALAGALAILFVAFHPFGDVAILSSVKGEVTVLSKAELAILGATFGAVVACLALFRRELLMSSFDRELTALLKGRVGPWDLLFHLLAGVTIALGVIVAGPLTLFGFLVLPAIAARPLVSGMAPYFMVSSLAGAGLGLAGFAVSYRFDLPLGPAGVVLGCGLVLATHAVAWAGSKGRQARGVLCAPPGPCGGRRLHGEDGFRGAPGGLGRGCSPVAGAGP